MKSSGIHSLSAVDCFAGCGGMSEGFRLAGLDVVGAIENDPQACDAFSLNHQRTRLWRRDIRDVEAEDVLRELGMKRGDLHLLGGCPPCQGFSTLRTFNGHRIIQDTQNDLIVEFQRLVLGLNPKYVMMENVPGLYVDERFDTFRTALESAGYVIKARLLNVADYGVPQRRLRLVALASRVSPILFADPVSKRRTVRDAIGHLPPAGKSGDALHDIPETRAAHVREIIASIPKDGGNRTSLPKHLVLKCHKAVDGFKDVYGRLSWDRQASTITTGCFNPSKGRFLHPTENRNITMREAALLQSFPEEYKFPIKSGKLCIARMIGNALPPAFIAAHTKKLAIR